MKNIVAKVPLEEWLALDWLLNQIGSWTHSRWDQHLRDRFGDVRTDQIIEALGYRQVSTVEAPVSRQPDVAPCMYTKAKQEDAAKQLGRRLQFEATPYVTGVGIDDKDNLVVYVSKKSKRSVIPDHWDHWPVVVRRIGPVRPA